MALRPQRGRLRLVEPAAPAAPAAEAQEDMGDAGPLRSGGARPRRWPARRRTRTGRSAATGPAGRGAGLAELPDAQLVALGARGDAGALEELYRRHAAFAIHLATRIEGSARDVEDIVHDAFLRAFERLDDLVDPAAFRAWLGSIVVHKVRSRMRRARLISVLGMGKSSEPVDLDALASPAASPHARAQIAQIYALLQTLPADDRIAWTLRSVEGHDLETVAQMTRLLARDRQAADCAGATLPRRSLCRSNQQRGLS